MQNSKYLKIISSDNPKIKILEKLNLKKYRDEFGKFIVENLATIIDGLKDGNDFDSLFVTEEFISKHQEQIDFFENNSKSKTFYIIDQKLNKCYSSLEMPSGIAAVYNISKRKLDKTSVLYLNGVSDPGNLGTIMRSALAFHFVNIVLDRTCVDFYNYKVINAAKDAFFKLNIIEDKDGKWLKNNKLPVYVTSSHLGTELSKFKPAKIFCLVLGSESHGVSEEIIKLADANLKIEISPNIESLNVATAAAILLYKFRIK